MLKMWSLQQNIWVTSAVRKVKVWMCAVKSQTTFGINLSQTNRAGS